MIRRRMDSSERVRLGISTEAADSSPGRPSLGVASDKFSKSSRTSCDKCCWPSPGVESSKGAGANEAAIRPLIQVVRPEITEWVARSYDFVGVSFHLKMIVAERLQGRGIHGIRPICSTGQWVMSTEATTIPRQDHSSQRALNLKSASMSALVQPTPCPRQSRCPTNNPRLSPFVPPYETLLQIGNNQQKATPHLQLVLPPHAADKVIQKLQKKYGPTRPPRVPDVAGALAVIHRKLRAVTCSQAIPSSIPQPSRSGVARMRDASAKVPVVYGRMGESPHSAAFPPRSGLVGVALHSRAASERVSARLHQRGDKPVGSGGDRIGGQISAEAARR